MPSMGGGGGGGGGRGCGYNIMVWTLNFTLQLAVLEMVSRCAKTCERNSSQCLSGYFDEMAALTGLNNETVTSQVSGL